MSNLVVRNIDEAIVQSLEECAERHGRSRRRSIGPCWQIVLSKPRRRSLAQVLAAMPNAGDDADFARIHGDKTACVFD